MVVGSRIVKGETGRKAPSLPVDKDGGVTMPVQEKKPTARKKKATE